MLSYEAARAKVMEVIRARRCAPPPATETVEFAADPKKVLGRILAENIPADRNYPPFNRATRDGFAVRAPVSGAAFRTGALAAGISGRGSALRYAMNDAGPLRDILLKRKRFDFASC